MNMEQWKEINRKEKDGFIDYIKSIYIEIKDLFDKPQIFNILEAESYEYYKDLKTMKPYKKYITNIINDIINDII